jgi:flagellar export protein FliJ
MPAFRFRAQPALDLRRREHDVAQRALARAVAERQRARSRFEAAGHALAEAAREANEAARTREALHDAEWYRFWIVRLEQERAALHGPLAACEAAVVAAREQCLAARQRSEALERLREKAYVAHLAEEAAAERKVIDELAARRFAAGRLLDEGA